MNIKTNSFFDFITLDEYSATPKYLQLVNEILTAIENGNLSKDQILPSINEISYNFDISRSTAEKSYNYLKDIGVLNAYLGKGYFIANSSFRQRLRILLLFNKLSSHKKLIYDAFIKNLGSGVLVDFYIYNNDYTLFKRYLNHKKDNYSHYVIIPHFINADNDDLCAVLNNIPKHKLILLDKMLPNISGEFSAVYENFEKDIYIALESSLPELSNYNKLKIIFPKESYYPWEILQGFYRFSVEYAFDYAVVNDIELEDIKKGDVFINLMEDDLVTLIERIMISDYVIGKDIGVISYNETPLKKVILNGISTISTDFKYMGQMAAELIINNTIQQIETPFRYIKRNSV